MMAEAAQKTGVSLDAIEAMSPADVAVSTILFNAIADLRGLITEALNAGEKPELVLQQTVDQLQLINPVYVHERVHQSVAGLLSPPSTG